MRAIFKLFPLFYKHNSMTTLADAVVHTCQLGEKLLRFVFIFKLLKNFYQLKTEHITIIFGFLATAVHLLLHDNIF